MGELTLVEGIRDLIARGLLLIPRGDGPDYGVGDGEHQW